MVTTTPDIEAIRKRAEEIGARDIGDDVLLSKPVLVGDLNELTKYIVPALLSHIAAQDAEHKAEMLDFIVWVFRDEPVYHLDLGPEGVYAAYLAQKEKK